MDEYIEREAAIEFVSEWLQSVFGVSSTDNNIGVFKRLRMYSAADVRPVVRGKWIGDNRYCGFPNWHCSLCQGEGRGDYNYCPNCGADMREES